jgi:hypothetical protein
MYVEDAVSRLLFKKLLKSERKSEKRPAGGTMRSRKELGRSIYGGGSQEKSRFPKNLSLMPENHALKDQHAHQSVHLSYLHKENKYYNRIEN